MALLCQAKVFIVNYPTLVRQKLIMQTIVKKNNDYFLHQYFAEQTDSRLSLLRGVPEQITLIGADGDISRSLLAQRYPKASFTEYDHRADWLQAALAERKTGLLAKLTGKHIPQHHQTLLTPLPEASADMLWSNLALVWADEIVPVLENWAQALKTDGLLFFSHFGSNTLFEIQSLLAEHEITCTAHTLVDMHDLGDMLWHHGFYDPVTDTSQVVLTYTQATRFWQDMHTLGLWQALQPSNPVAAQAIVDKAWLAGQLTQITLETVFAHAIKKLRLPENESLVQFFPR